MPRWLAIPHVTSARPHPHIYRFASPQHLVGRATSGDAILQAQDEYGMQALDLLLSTCDCLLWPVLVGDEMHSQTLSKWLTFLTGIQRSIRAMVPEDQAVKVLATHLELEYRVLGTSKGLLEMHG